MERFAVVICPRNLDVFLKANIFFRYVPDGWKEIFVRQIRVDRLKQNDETGENGGWIVYLPRTAGRLERTGYKGLEKYIGQALKWCNSNAVKKVYYGKSIIHALKRSNPEAVQNEGLLYMALAKDVVREICRKKGWQIENIDICVIARRDSETLFSLLELLLPDVKFLTIVTADEQSVAEKLRKTYEETGEAVRVTSDLKSGTRDCNIIITLDLLPDHGDKDIFKAGTALINFSGTDVKDSTYIKSEVVNNIDITIPEVVRGNIAYVRELEREFSSLETAEILLRNEEALNGRDLIMYRTMFGTYGMKLKNLVGRHGVI